MPRRERDPLAEIARRKKLAAAEMARWADQAVEWARTRPREPVHPLRIALWERNLTYQDAAKILRVSPRTIKNLVAWRHSPASYDDKITAKRAKVMALYAALARAFGFEERELFPYDKSRAKLFPPERK